MLTEEEGNGKQVLNWTDLYVEYIHKINYQVGGTTVLYQMVSRYFL